MKNFKVITTFLLFATFAGLASIAQAVSLGSAEQYNPQYKPSDFTIAINNPYFSIPVGTTMIYEAKTKEGLERIEIMVPGWTRTVDSVQTLVFWDRVYRDDVLIEDTRDYLAQHTQTGELWYFGEDVDNYENGKFVDHHGAWIAGVNGAKAGIWMLANPQVGDEFRNEYYKGEAEDITKIVAINQTVTVPSGTYDNCVKTLDWSPLFEHTANKYFCKGLAGTALEVELPSSDKPTEERVELLETNLKGALGSQDRGIPLPSAYRTEGVQDLKKEVVNRNLVTCAAAQWLTVPMPTTKLYFEYNSTGAKDTGVHGAFDSSSFAELCVYDPNGKQILAVKPQNELGDLNMAGIFFESREPEEGEIPQRLFCKVSGRKI